MQMTAEIEREREFHQEMTRLASELGGLNQLQDRKINILAEPHIPSLSTQRHAHDSSPDKALNSPLGRAPIEKALISHNTRFADAQQNGQTSQAPEQAAEGEWYQGEDGQWYQAEPSHGEGEWYQGEDGQWYQAEPSHVEGEWYQGEDGQWYQGSAHSNLSSVAETTASRTLPASRGGHVEVLRSFGKISKAEPDAVRVLQSRPIDAPSRPDHPAQAARLPGCTYSCTAHELL